MKPLSRFASYFVMALSVSVLAAHNYFGTVNEYDTGIPTLRSLQQVVDLPNAPPFRLANGDWIDLGYKHHLLAGGVWVKTVQSQHAWNLTRPRQYFEMTDSQLANFIEEAGLGKLPPLPRRPVPVLIMDWGVTMAIISLLTKLLSVLFGFGPVLRGRNEDGEVKSFDSTDSHNTVVVRLSPTTGPVRFGKR